DWRSPQAEAARPGRAREQVVVFVCRRCRRGSLCGARARRHRRTLRPRRRQRDAGTRLRDRAAAHRPPPAAADPVRGGDDDRRRRRTARLALWRHAAADERRGRDLPPRLVARQQPGSPRPRLPHDAARGRHRPDDRVHSAPRAVGRPRDFVNAHSERARQWVHIGSGGFAFLLRWLTWWQAAMLAIVALAFNLVLLPRLGGRSLYRPSDVARGFPLGILLYPLAVLLLILTFPSRLDIVAVAWAILAVGDGTATLLGTRINSRKLPWNPDKSIAGTSAFIVFAAFAGVALASWVRPAVVPLPPLAFTLIAPVAAAIVAAAVTLWIASLMTPESLAAAPGPALSTLPAAIAVNLVTAVLGYLAKSVSISGAVAGAMVGIVIYTGGGGGAWTLLFAAFLAASITSRMGLRRKVVLGIAEERGGRRGAGNSIANCGVAAIAAIAALTTAYRSEALLALAAALIAGGSDTVASEIGKAWGRSTFLVTTLGRVRPGTPGAMSAEGTAAGIAAAFALAAAAAAFGLIPGTAIVVVVVAATGGALVESALGATLEGPGILHNDMLNFINTAVAAAVALALA